MLIFRLLVVTVVGALACGAPLAAEPAKKPPSKAAATPPPVSPFHRGMRGEASPHNGWANYSRLSLDIGSDRYFIYDQGAGEFSATVIERVSETIKLRAISIPGAGFFYYPAEASPCAPDALERIGLYAEQLLFYLSSAFPAGPKSIDAQQSATVDRDVPELHFMDGVMKAHGGSRTLITAVPLPSNQIGYLLQDDKEKVRGAWEPRRSRSVVPDDEVLVDWNACWSGTWSTRADGGSSFKPNLADATSLKTFGEVRKALRAMRREGKKQ